MIEHRLPADIAAQLSVEVSDVYRVKSRYLKRYRHHLETLAKDAGADFAAVNQYLAQLSESKI